jgi:hypothetical protein
LCPPTLGQLKGFLTPSTSAQETGLAGWRRSADCTCLHANSLVTGNFTGNFAIPGRWETVLEQETAVPQSLLGQFPTRIIRENNLKNKEF